MGESYRGFFYGPAYIVPGYKRDPNEFAGYYNNLILQYPPEPVAEQKSPQPVKPAQAAPGYKHTKELHQGRTARPLWDTEIPTQMMVPICCNECKTKLEKNLRNMEGVHDVAISGWKTAKVTVTGTAPMRKLLQQARMISSMAEPWSAASSVDEFSPQGTYLARH